MPAASLDVGPQGCIGVAWTSGHADELGDVYFAESIDGGASFGPNFLVTETHQGIQELPDLCYDDRGGYICSGSMPGPRTGTTISCTRPPTTTGSASIPPSGSTMIRPRRAMVSRMWP
ncbi:MAG: hypothetical protein GF330_10880 [Candidatus Eisenbacteria bacterium]|nr:hypothetical protein [Candidatus Eisenbacteria bacterium]